VDNELLAHINNIIQTLQDIDGLRFVEISTPTAPAATKHKLYFKSDGNAYTLDSSSSEVQITGIDILQYQVFT